MKNVAVATGPVVAHKPLVVGTLSCLLVTRHPRLYLTLSGPSVDISGADDAVLCISHVLKCHDPYTERAAASHQSPPLLSVTSRDTKERLSGKCVNWPSRAVTLCELPAAVIAQEPHRRDVFKQQKPHLSRFWRPGVQNPGLGRATFPLTAVGQVLPLLPASVAPSVISAPGLRGPPPTCLSVFTWSSSLPCVAPLRSLLYKHRNH